MTDYDEDIFERDEDPNEKKHLLKFSIDILSVKDLKVSANLIVQYTMKLLQTHSFKSSPPTPVSQNSEAKLQNSFASYEFQIS